MIMHSILVASAALALSFQAAPSGSGPAPAAELSQENTALLRCSAAFALVSFGQEAGSEDALKWPQIDPRGREFFVRAMAKIMDDTGMDRDQVSELASAEAQKLLDADQVNSVMPACLTMLESSGV